MLCFHNAWIPSPERAPFPETAGLECTVTAASAVDATAAPLTQCAIGPCPRVRRLEMSGASFCLICRNLLLRALLSVHIPATSRSCHCGPSTGSAEPPWMGVSQESQLPHEMSVSHCRQECAMCVRTRTHTHTHTQIHMYIHICTYIHMCIHIYTYAHLHNIYTYTHTHTHIAF